MVQFINFKTMKEKTEIDIILIGDIIEQAFSSGSGYWCNVIHTIKPEKERAYKKPKPRFT